MSTSMRLIFRSFVSIIVCVVNKQQYSLLHWYIILCCFCKRPNTNFAAQKHICDQIIGIILLTTVCCLFTIITTNIIWTFLRTAENRRVHRRVHTWSNQWINPRRLGKSIEATRCQYTGAPRSIDLETRPSRLTKLYTLQGEVINDPSVESQRSTGALLDDLDSPPSVSRPTSGTVQSDRDPSNPLRSTKRTRPERLPLQLDGIGRRRGRWRRWRRRRQYRRKRFASGHRQTGSSRSSPAVTCYNRFQASAGVTGFGAGGATVAAW